jgi:hypothetical protein
VAIRSLIFLLGFVVTSFGALVFLGFFAFLWYMVLLPVSLCLAVPACIISSCVNGRNMLSGYAAWFAATFWSLPADIIPDLILGLYEPPLSRIMDDPESSSSEI